MKLILHFGMPKAGSNALQQLFHARRDLLLEYGVLYPQSVLGSPDRHHHLTIPAFEGKRLPTAFKSLNTRQSMAQFEEVWASVMEQVVDSKPDLVILSTEALFRRLSPAGAHAIYKRLCEISTDITGVGYIRQMHSFYQSLVQQRVLSQGAIPPAPRPSEILDAIVSYEAMFGSDSIKLFPYEAGKDVVDDFCSLLEPFGLNREMLGNLPGRANKSLSAASMYILLNYKQNTPLDGNGPLTKYSGSLASLLKDLDTRLDLTSPVLTTQVRKALHPNAEKLEQQLEARYGMQFSVPTSSEPLTSDGTDALNFAKMNSLRVTDVSEVDSNEVLQLLEALHASSWVERHSSLPNWLREQQKFIKENGL